MTTPPPFLTPLAQAAVPAALAAAPEGDAGMPGAFDELIEALGQASSTAPAPNPAGDAVVPPPAPAAPPNQAAMPAEAQAIVVSAGTPAPAQSEEALTQAVGGKDDSAEAADAAVAAAIELGLAPQQSQRLVLAVPLPVGLRSAASVRILDQLLDGMTAPTAPIRPASATPTSQTPGPHSPAAIAAPAFGEPLPAAPAAAPAAAPSVEVAPQPIFRGHAVMAVTSRINAAAAQMPTASLSEAPASPAELRVAPFALFAGATAPAEPQPVLAQAVPPAATEPASAATAQHPAEPAITFNGAGGTQAIERPRQHIGFDGFDGPVRISLDHAAADGRRASLAPQAAFQGGLVAPTTAAALAAQGAPASNANGHVPLTNNAGVSADAAPATGGALSATAGPDGFLGEHGTGNFGAGNGSPMLGAGLGETGLSGLDAGADGAESFAALLNGQAMPSAARPTTGGAAPLPTMVPHAVAPEQLAIHIAAAAQNGMQNLSVQLRPAALGRIEVQLAVGRDGTVRARVLAERAETLELLQRHADGLEHALEAAGLKAETGGLSFSLRNGGDGTGEAWRAEAALPPAQGETIYDERAAGPIAALPPAGLDGRTLDIRV